MKKLPILAVVGLSLAATIIACTGHRTSALEAKPDTIYVSMPLGIERVPVELGEEEDGQYKLVASLPPNGGGKYMAMVGHKGRVWHADVTQSKDDPSVVTVQLRQVVNLTTDQKQQLEDAESVD